MRVFKVMLLSIFLFASASAQSLQTHDVPMFHNDDGLGLLQDCLFMRARAKGELSDIPTTVAGRSTDCLSSIKSVTHVLYQLQTSNSNAATCLPSTELEWFEVVEFVINFMQKQTEQKIASHPYGVWIMHALQEKYACA